MILRDTNIQAALRARSAARAKQRGFFLNPYRFGAGGGGGDPSWANVSALLHMDGTDGGTSFPDETGKTWTRTGNVTTQSAVTKFGQSAYFDGLGGNLAGPSSADFTFGTGDFTIECWSYCTNASSNRGIFAFNSNMVLYYASSGVTFFFDGSTNLVSAGPNRIGTVNHYALVRASGVVSVWADGIRPGSSSAFTANITSTNMVIGNNTSATGAHLGYIDEFRVTKGVARYTSDFTPPTAPFSSSV